MTGGLQLLVTILALVAVLVWIDHGVSLRPRPAARRPRTRPGD